VVVVAAVVVVVVAAVVVVVVAVVFELWPLCKVVIMKYVLIFILIADLT